MKHEIWICDICGTSTDIQSDLNGDVGFHFGPNGRVFADVCNHCIELLIEWVNRRAKPNEAKQIK